MYAGRRRILIQGAVSEPVHATHGMPLGRGHAVDLLHSFLLKALQSAGRLVEVRKYVDDVMLVAKAALCGESLPGLLESSPQPHTSQHEGEPQEDGGAL
eukprot:5931060-Amphidinium_carterae.2